MPSPNRTPPFAVSDAELSEVEGFCSRNGLDQIGRICAELRTLRSEYILLAGRVGKQRGMIETLEHDPNKRYARELDVITTDRTNDAAPIT